MTRPDDPLADLARKFGVFAETEVTSSPLYHRISRALATDTAPLEPMRGVHHKQRRPVLFLAAVHDLVLQRPDADLAAIYRGDRDGDPWPAFRSFALEHAAEIEALVTRRRTQTNEVGRGGALLPALIDVARAQPAPLALVDLGASAGLNLLLDRWGYGYGDRLAGDPSAPVQLTVELRGACPPLTPRPAIAFRLGIDVAPMDVRDDDDCRWLRACVWPDMVGRLARLDAALAVARADPPTLLEGDIVSDLPGALATVPPDAHLTLLSTWTLSYLTAAQRAQLTHTVADLSRRRPITWITAEHEGLAPDLAPPSRPARAVDNEGVTLLGRVDYTAGAVTASRPLAWMHAHGIWLDWLA